MPKKKISYWSTFREKARYYMFGPHLEEDEQIIFVVHRHFFVILRDGLKISFLHLFLPIFFWYVFPELWFAFLVWLLYGFIAINKMIFNWYFDAILVTSKSLIDVKWNGPFDRESLRLEYSMVEGTSPIYKGIVQTVFNFGTIQVNRQGGDVGLELKDAVNPSKAESVIMSYQEKFLDNKNVEDVDSLKNLLGEMIKKHVKEMKEIEVDY